MTTLVGHEHRWTVIVEMASVVVRVHCKCPTACFPSHRAIEMGKSYILIELPTVQDIAEVCVTAIPPDAEDITVSVQAHQVVEVDLIDCLILCIALAEIVMTIIIARIISRLVLTIVFFISLSPILLIVINPRLTPAPYQGSSNVHGAKYGIFRLICKG